MREYWCCCCIIHYQVPGTWYLLIVYASTWFVPVPGTAVFVYSVLPVLVSIKYQVVNYSVLQTHPILHHRQARCKFRTSIHLVYTADVRVPVVDHERIQEFDSSCFFSGSAALSFSVLSSPKLAARVPCTVRIFIVLVQQY